jgi:hypothetical protein
MQSFKRTFPVWAAATVAIAGAAASLPSQVVPASPASAPVARAVTAAAAVAAITTPAAPPVIALATTTPAAKAVIAFTSPDELREQIKFETVKWAGKPVKTLDEASRILLAQAAAEKAGLNEVGLSYKDVYGVIEAETSWVPRSGMGNNGVQSHGLAQFEPRTAKGLGLTDPNDPVQAVFAAAVNIKHGAQWAQGRIAPLKLAPDEYAMKLREGVSVYYNLSIKGRNKWDGLNTAELPIETQRHIRTVRAGAEEAAELARQLPTI